MQTPTARLLELLELLQARPLTTGGEIADQLEIDRRTVRRYVAALQELGIPVEGQRGVGGGYRVRPGYRLPPLMLSDDEAVVVVLGLIAARRQGLDSDSGSVDGALTKIHRVLPDPLRRRVEALETTLGFTASPRAGAPVTGDTVLLLADAVRRGRRVRTAYRSYAGERDATRAEPATAWSSTRAAGTSPRTTTSARTCARSGSTGCARPVCSTLPLSRRPRGSTRSST